MEKSLQHIETSRFSGLTYDLFETHRSVVIRLLLPHNTDPRHVVIENKRAGIRISGVPGKNSEMIHLPAPVMKRSGKAALVGRILEIRLMKRKKTTKSKTVKVPIR